LICFLSIVAIFITSSGRIPLLHAVSHGAQSFKPGAVLDPIHQEAHRHLVVRRLHQPGKVIRVGLPFTRKTALGRPIRSIAPSRIRKGGSPASNSANLMLDEPPLIVRTCGLVGFMGSSHIIS
jgi:hypothetical protein